MIPYFVRCFWHARGKPHRHCCFCEAVLFGGEDECIDHEVECAIVDAARTKIARAQAAGTLNIVTGRVRPATGHGQRSEVSQAIADWREGRTSLSDMQDRLDILLEVPRAAPGTGRDGTGDPSAARAQAAGKPGSEPSIGHGHVPRPDTTRPGHRPPSASQPDGIYKVHGTVSWEPLDLPRPGIGTQGDPATGSLHAPGVNTGPGQKPPRSTS